MAADGKAETPDNFFTTTFDAPLKLRDFDPSKEATSISPRAEGESWEEYNIRCKQAAPETVVSAFEGTVQKFGDREAICVKRDGKWVKWTWNEYNADVLCCARASVALGLSRFGVSSILGFNSPEWFIAYMGAIFAGGVATGIYATNNADGVHYVLDHSESELVFVENEAQLEKIVAIADRLKNVKAVVQWMGKPSADAAASITKAGIEHVLDWEGFMAFGKDASDENTLAATVAERKESWEPSHATSLIYTSGTTGNPKAVMISHDNLIWTSRIIASMFQFDETDIGVSYLPLSHIAAQLLDLAAPFTIGAATYFAQPDALKGSLGETLKDVRPTIFFGVPRVWEKIFAKMKEIGKANTGLKKTIGDWAKGVGAEGNKNIQHGGTTPWGWWLASTLVFSKVKVALGLDRCKFFATGAAPLALEVMEYFNSLDIPIREVYGMSECAGPQTFNTKEHWRTGTAGVKIPGTEMKIAEDGEICYQGRNVFMGYLKQHDATAETIDEDGWLHSGDIGKIDAEGFLRITGRKKELLITAGGENVAPVLIEDEIKKAIPDLVNNVMVIGDKQKYLTCLVTFAAAPKDPQKIEEGEYPFEADLSAAALEVCAAIGSDAKTVAEACEDDKIRAHVEAGIKAANGNAISRAQNIQKFHPLGQDFTLEGNELTPTMKLKRRIVLEKYDKEVRSLYGEDYAE